MVICGVDEVGRGPLAGPVTAAAVVLPIWFPFARLADSKQVEADERFEVAAIIRRQARAHAIGWAWPREIDRINIHHATLLAMRRAVTSLPLIPDLVAVDGSFAPEFESQTICIVKGDDQVPEIAAASIVAKVARDRWMQIYDRIEPGWGFARHKGYPTPEHREALQRLGASPIHRLSWVSVRSALPHRNQASRHRAP